MPEKKKKKLPKAPPSRPRHANPKHPMNTERTGPLRKKKGGATKKKMPTPPKSRPTKRERDKAKRTSTLIGQIDEVMNPGGRNSRANKNNPRNVPALSEVLQGTYRYGKEKVKDMASPMKKGGKLKMVEKDGKKVPFFAADGVGKMAKGGKMKKSDDLLYKVTGLKDPRGYKKEAPTPKKKVIKKASGGSVKVGQKGAAKTLSQIAKQNNTSIQALLAANPSIKNANQIRMGQTIKLPKAGSVPGNTKTKNPYARMSQTQMNMMRSKDKGQQRAVTSAMRNEVKRSGAQTSATPKKAKAVKDSRSAVPEAKKKELIAKAKANQSKKPKKKSLLSRLFNKKAGGSMKKVQGYKSGGMVRGAGAATKGKRFGRAG